MVGQKSKPGNYCNNFVYGQQTFIIGTCTLLIGNLHFTTWSV